MAESEEEVKSLLMKVKEESEKVGLKFVTFYGRQGSNHPQEKEVQKGKMVV